MRIEISTITTDESVRPAVVAKALEEHRFDPPVVAVHSHV
jgi:hypothetical protein